ncbi:MAG: 30S ribosomal protein S1 [Planctomycetota bacterium]|jgi:small subunit ribosomal protein S1
MVSKKLLKKYDIDAETLEKAVEEAFGEDSPEDLPKLYEDSIKNFSVDTIIKGKVIRILSNEVLVDIGYKSEGVISTTEFDSLEDVKINDEIEVLLESIEDESGLIVLSKRKADRIRGWERIISTHKEGDVVKGKAIRKIKGGLLVDIGVPVFLPASQVSIRRSRDIADYIDKELECKIIKIDEARMNIVVSRRKLIEEQREKQRDALLAELEEGQIRTGTVKNIADFGAFVDLGGIDGLLHITDMSWGRINHPSEVVSIDEEIEVMVLKFDKDKGRIALGLKQKTQSPWLTVKEKYPIGSKATGTVVNIMPYGAFVKLEDGIEGLVHISEMSWTKRVNHPSEMVSIDDVVEVMVLEINVEKQEISLGIKQTDVNPWELVEQRYPTGTIIEGTVRNITSYGAFVEIEEGIDGLLHVSDMSWTKKINHPSEILKKGERVKAVVLTVDPGKKRVALGIKQLNPDPWLAEIPDKYTIGEVVTGTVTKITNFGVFVELEEGLEGLLHISELSSRKVNTPEEVVKVGNKVDVRILKIDPEERKIGLSMINVDQSEHGVSEDKKAEKDQEEKKPDQAEEAKAEEPAAEVASEEPVAMAADATETPVETETPAEAEAPQETEAKVETETETPSEPEAVQEEAKESEAPAEEAPSASESEPVAEEAAPIEETPLEEAPAAEAKPEEAEAAATEEAPKEEEAPAAPPEVAAEAPEQPEEEQKEENPSDQEGSDSEEEKSA